MPYGLFDYGGTIQTMGAGEVTLMLGEDGKMPVYTRAMPEDPSTPITMAFPEDGVVKVRADDLPPVGTARYPEDPSTPVTLRMPEDPSQIIKIKADEAPPSGGCPKGYEPTGKNPPNKSDPQFYVGSGLSNQYTDAFPE